MNRKARLGEEWWRLRCFGKCGTGAPIFKRGSRRGSPDGGVPFKACPRRVSAKLGMTLATLLLPLDVVSATGNLKVELSGITDDSREVAQGSLFVAVKGQQVDGHSFAAQVYRQQIGGVVVQAPFQAPSPRQERRRPRLDRSQRFQEGARPVSLAVFSESLPILTHGGSHGD